MAPVAPTPQLPPKLTGNTPALVSKIPLPPSPFISYVKYVTPSDVPQQQQHRTIELARQRIVNRVRQASRRLVDSLLPIACIGKEEAALWVFAIGSLDPDRYLPDERKGKESVSIAAVEELEAFDFAGLQRSQFSQFIPSTLYPCSPECASLPTPCGSCPINSADNSTTRSVVSSPSTILPRASLRPIYSLFVNAIRDKLIDDVCALSVQPAELHMTTPDLQPPVPTVRATRLGDGFLSIEDDDSPTWGSGWEHRNRNRTLIHTTFHIFVSSAIHIYPFPTVTHLRPVRVCQPSASSHPTTPTVAPCPTDSLTPGSPLILSPYATPAFYISAHLGTTLPGHSLSLFWDALAGLGAYAPPHPTRNSSPRSSLSPNAKHPLRSTNLTRGHFVLVFVPLTNPQGEPKGITALWPSHLAFMDTSPNRSFLTSLPDVLGTEASLLTTLRAPGLQSPSQPSQPPVAFSKGQNMAFGSSKFVSQCQRAFRVLELSAHRRLHGESVPTTAKQTAGFVENVARERERERERANQERVKRERDLKEGKSLAPGPSVSTAVTIDVPQTSQVVLAPSVLPLPSLKTPTSLSRQTSLRSPMSSFFIKAAQGVEVNLYYPSPPDWDPITTSSGPNTSEIPALGSTAPTAPNLSTETGALSSIKAQHSSNVSPQIISNDLNVGSSVNLGMDVDMSMGMGINLNASMGFDMQVDIDGGGLMDGAFGSFTDDDFSYFDTAPAGIPLSASHLTNSLDELDATEENWLSNGPHQEGADAAEQLQRISSVLQEETPKSVEDDLNSQQIDSIRVSEDNVDFLPSAPDLIPSSPAKSPWSPGNPPTPTLEFGVPQTHTEKGIFGSIDFGRNNWLADGKYTDVTGKFSFPVKSSSLDWIFTLGSPTLLGSDKDDGWKLRYDAVTDPRVGVINRLRGVKRKLPQGTERERVVRSRVRDEEWASFYDHDEDADVDTSETSSSSESDDEMEEIEHAQDQDDTSSSSLSRPNTPVTAGLPLTATPLYTHFNHAHLLHLGVPMRSSYGALVSPSDPPHMTVSVPTPVSPAAALGNSTERNRTLEVLAQAIAKEAVENDVWAEAWSIFSNATHDAESEPAGPERKVTQGDLKNVSGLLGKVDGLCATTPLSGLLDADPLAGCPTVPAQGTSTSSLELMQSPHVTVGRAGLVHSMLPTTIRFWEKEGLSPRGGTKDVVAFALFEEGEERSVLVDRWLQRVSRAYQARGLGSHTTGNAGEFERGLVPVQFESVRKTLSNLMLVLPVEAHTQHTVLYVIAPPSVLFSLKSPVLQTLFLNRNHAPKFPGQHDFDQDRILIHLVPDHFVADPHTYPISRYVGLERFVTSVYDRLLRPIVRQTSRRIWECNAPFEHRFQVPAYVLSRKLPLQTHFEWSESPSLNVLDRHMFLQVGYRVSQCGKWLVAACIDERGEAHDVAVWSVPDTLTTIVNWVVSNVWTFAKQFVQRADTEWRIVVAKLGEMGENEVEEWMSHLETLASSQPDMGPPIHVSLVCAQNDVPLSFISSPDMANERNAIAPMNSNGVFTDISSTTYSACLSDRIPIISSASFCPPNHPSTVPPSLPDESEQPPAKNVTGVLPISTTALFRVPNETDLTNFSTLYIHLLHVYNSVKSTLKRTTREIHADITRNWYELAVLTRERWHFARHDDLPFQLAALQVMSDALKPLSSIPDSLKESELLGG